MSPGGSVQGRDGFRVGVVIVAYNAERTITRVLERIPQAFWNECAGVWLSDDGSMDATEELARAWGSAHPNRPLTVVRQPRNLGYGGNQKAGYRWAIEARLDAVVLLHGDGQYAPEVIGQIVEPIRRGTAEAVLGSRMMRKGEARRGGMPLYKLIGNRVLTVVQNWATGAGFSEWHSGYRAYSVPALASIDFAVNRDDFAFDTDILLQLLAHPTYRFTEIAIPTFYGTEISRVNGLKYAWEIVIASLLWRRRHSRSGVESTEWSTSTVVPAQRAKIWVLPGDS
jgi:glycosyltransferase involved in cell wall biosynthesis